MTQTIGFLGTTRTVTADVPDTFDELPHLRTAIGSQRAWRQVSFFPSERFDHPAKLDYLMQVGQMVDAEGSSVAVYEQRGDPPVRMAVWDIAGGFGTTAFNPGPAGELETVVGSIAMKLGDHFLPRLFTYGSEIIYQDPQYPSRRDVAVFSGGKDGELDCLTFSYMPSGVRDADDGFSEERVIEVAYVDDFKVSWSTMRAEAPQLPDRFQSLMKSISLG